MYMKSKAFHNKSVMFFPRKSERKFKVTSTRNTNKIADVANEY